MKLKTRLGRDLDLRLRSNQLVVAITLATAVAAGVRVLTGQDARMLLTPVLAYALWTLMREIDPDHDWTAIVAAVVGAAWGLTGESVDTWAATFALMLAARLVVNTTGRRPYMTDLIFVGVVGVVVATNIWGWVAGFSLAIAMYVDDRMAEVHKTYSVVIAALTALGASIVATAAQVFPQQTPDFQQALVIVAGLLSLIMLGRDPAEPRSLVDSRMKNPISHARLHAGRSLVAVNVFAATLLAGSQALTVAPWVFCLALAVFSSETARFQRRRG